MKKISILVPCCNVEKYIRECLDSIKNQTYSNLEIICINDGSTDNTGKIIDEYVATDSRFKAIHKPNSGYGDSMNQGLDMCTGDYIGIVESDDWIEPNMYEKLYDTCLEHDLDLVKCLWYSGPTGTENIDQLKWIPKDQVYTPLEKQNVLLMQPTIWAALYRRDLLEEGRKVRFLPTPGASFQDTSFAFKAYSKSKRFMLISTALHHYRINPNSSVSSSGKITCIVDEWNEMRRWINEDPVLKGIIVKNEIFMRIIYGGLMWNYLRLSTTARLIFIRAANQFFRNIEKDGLFNLYGLVKKEEGDILLQILYDPLTFHNNKIQETVNRLFKDKDSVCKCEQKDLISIVVACYNTEKYIISSLNSIIRQSYKNIEIICVDDCSTDSTATLVKHLMRKDTRIQYICTEKNSGLSAVRNLGLSKCQGQYVMFVDGDDCLMPNSISILYSTINKNPDVDVVMGSIIVGYEEGREAYGNIPQSDDRYYTIKKDKFVNVQTTPYDYLNINVSAWGKLWRCSIIERYHIRFPEGLYYEDANFFWKYLSVAPKLFLSKEYVYHYQRHLTGSIMSNTFNKKKGLAIQHLYILEDLYEFICNHKTEDTGKKILSMVYEPYFWFAYNYSPQSDYDNIFTTICNILNQQKVDTSNNPLLDHLKNYNASQKSEIYLELYNSRKEIEKMKKKKTLWRKIKNIFKRS